MYNEGDHILERQCTKLGYVKIEHKDCKTGKMVINEFNKIKDKVKNILSKALP